MALEVPLDRLQRWLQAVVVHPGSTGEAVAAPAARALVPRRRVGDVILPSATLRPEERLAVYRRRYTVWRQDLTRAGYGLLRDLATGKRLGSAVSAALRRGRGQRPSEADLFAWFRGWVGAGMFRSIELG